jgi:serine/threonine-protein kinase HipA
MRPESITMNQQPAMRFSLAGVQLKFSAITQALGGLTIPATGAGGDSIVKLPSMRFEAVPENEFVMLSLARRIGIDVPAVRLMPVDAIGGLPAEVQGINGNVLVVARFDRHRDGQRIHMEDFAQVFGVFPDAKYEKCSYATMAAVLAAEVGSAAVTDFVARLTFSILIGNADMHLKNWSLIYLDGRHPVLAPAYDYVCTTPYLPNQQLALGFGRSRAMDTITPEQVRRFADTAKVSAPVVWQTVVQTIDSTLDAWNDLPEQALLPEKIRATVEKHMQLVAVNVMRHVG